MLVYVQLKRHIVGSKRFKTRRQFCSGSSKQITHNDDMPTFVPAARRVCNELNELSSIPRLSLALAVHLSRPHRRHRKFDERQSGRGGLPDDLDKGVSMMDNDTTGTL